MEEKKKNNKKRLTIGIICLVLVGIVVLLFGTYAYWQITEKQTNKNLVGSACLQITFSNETGDINLEKQWPTSDADGSKLVPYTFTLTNTCPDELVAYTVALEEIKDDSNDPITYPDEYLSDANIKLKFDSLAPMKISTLDDITSDSGQTYEIYKTKKIINRKLAGGESRTHSLRLWLDQNAPETEMNKFFLSKIKIIAGQGIEEECYSVNSDGVLYAYDSDCGTSATIPATVKEKQVKTIASNAFKGDKQVRVVKYIDGYLKNSLKVDDYYVDSINDFYALNHTYYCGSNPCTIDITQVIKPEFGKLMSSEEEMGRVWEENEFQDENEFFAWISEHFSADDFYIVINYDGNDAARMAALREYAVEQLTGAYQQFNWPATSEIINAHIYTAADAPDSSDCYEDYYGSYLSDNNWIVSSYVIGKKEPTNEYVTKFGLLIDSLDLSQATNLEKIEAAAFSNWPNPSDASVSDITDITPGLTSLTFGNNTHAIQISGAAFAGANLETLTIYSNQEARLAADISAAEASNMANTTLAKLYSVMGPFVFSKIGTLNIVQTGTDTDYHFGAVEEIDYEESNELSVSVLAGLSQATVDNLNIGEGITHLYGAYLDYDSRNANIDLPSTLSYIGDFAFCLYNGSDLTIPNSVTYIGNNAFASYVGTGKTLTIPASVKTIGKKGFNRFAGSQLNFNEGLVSIGDKAFWYYAGPSFTLPSTIRNLGFKVFANIVNDVTHVNMTETDFNTLVTKDSNWNNGRSVVFLNN